ncbi:MAG: ABC transporter permease [Lachnospiraceae bacterium]|nr:ABC transporter permease [Lachnospiraceae bacterium]
MRKGSFGWNGRKRTFVLFVLALALLTVVTLWGQVAAEKAMETDFSRKDLAPCLEYPFGTDWMGRDMFLRTLTGLSMSIRIGLLAAGVSALVAVGLGTAAATLGRTVDGAITWVIDLVMGIPHILLLILISYACGKGFRGVVTGVALTHWTSLARVMRGEVLQLKEAPYIKMAEKLGTEKLEIIRKHMLPHLFPQFLVGLILMFPHAILHEASITFLGFGLSPEQPAIGVILSESMKYLAMGKWWLALFPGLLLVLTVVLFDVAGESLRRLLDPGSAHE